MEAKHKENFAVFDFMISLRQAVPEGCLSKLKVVVALTVRAATGSLLQPSAANKMEIQERVTK